MSTGGGNRHGDTATYTHGLGESAGRGFVGFPASGEPDAKTAWKETMAERLIASLAASTCTSVSGTAESKGSEKTDASSGDVERGYYVENSPTGPRHPRPGTEASAKIASARAPRRAEDEIVAEPPFPLEYGEPRTLADAPTRGEFSRSEEARGAVEASPQDIDGPRRLTLTGTSPVSAPSIQAPAVPGAKHVSGAGTPPDEASCGDERSTRTPIVSAYLVSASPQNDILGTEDHVTGVMEEPDQLSPQTQNRWIKWSIAALVLCVVGLGLVVGFVFRKRELPSNKPQLHAEPPPSDPPSYPKASTQAPLEQHSTAPPQTTTPSNEDSNQAHHPKTPIPPPPPPTPEPTPTKPFETNGPTSSSVEELKDLICDELPSSCPDLSYSQSPQLSALKWLASNPNLPTYPNKKKLHRFALASLYFSTVGLEGRGSWMNQTIDECAWNEIDIKCKAGVVTKIDLSAKLSGGRAPRELALLRDSLERLDLGPNQLEGPIPTELGELSKVRYLSLWSNKMDYTIPTQLGMLENLESLGLGDNKLVGTIQTQLGQLQNLVRLYVSNNKLVGTIPTYLGQLRNLTDLRLHGNGLTGSVPSEVCSIPGLYIMKADCKFEVTCDCCSVCY